MTIQDMTLEERPREKMILNGAGSLTDAELLAILIRTGTKQFNAIQLGKAIIEKADNIRYLQNITIEELESINCIGKTKAVQIKAALELGNRIASYKPAKYKIKNPWDIYKYYMESLRYQYKEIFKVVLLNTKNEIITDVDISMGTLNSSLVHPREVFKEAYLLSASGIICIHNHPSGDVNPSREDKVITLKLKEIGLIHGIKIIDHIIIGSNSYFSFFDNDML